MKTGRRPKSNQASGDAADLSMSRALAKPLPSLEILDSLLVYDPSGGALLWKKERGNGIKIGQRAGSINSKGYERVFINGEYYRSSRIAWKMYYKKDPTSEIDHVDTVKTNNSIENLREATGSQNAWNTGKRRDNTSGQKGVRRSGKKWVSVIKIFGKRIYLGTFQTIEQACEVRLLAAALCHGEFAR